MRLDIRKRFAFWQNESYVSKFWKFYIWHPINHLQLNVIIRVICCKAVSIRFIIRGIFRKSGFAFEKPVICIIYIPAGIFVNKLI